MSSPRISIVIAAYNAAATVSETLATVAGQTYRDFELIVVNDGSRDETPAILQSHARSWPWMSWVSQENSGVSAARERGIELARGEYVSFLDADDLWMPNKLEAQMAEFDRDETVALVCSDALDFWPDHDERMTLFQQKAPARGSVLRQLFSANFIYSSAVVVRKSALLAANGFNGGLKVNEDYDLWMRLAEQLKFGYVNQVLVRRRMLLSSLTRANQMACYEQDLKIIDHWVARRPDLFSEDSDQVQCRRALILARMGYYHLASRNFSQARDAYRRAMKLGQHDRATIARALAAFFPPAALLFWKTKAIARRSI